MKKQSLKTLMVAILMGVSVFAMAGNGNVEKKAKKEESKTLEVKIYPRSNGLVAVNFSKEEDETIRVSIYNEFGDRIFTEKISSHKLVAKKYDISNLKADRLYFEVSNENYLIRQVVEN